MATVLQDTTVVGVVTQTQPASAANHLIRLGEAQQLLNSQFQGTWNANTTYSAQQGVTWNGSYYISTVSANRGHQPDTSPSQWRVAAQAGQSAYVYVAYADDANGTGFTTTFDAAKNYIAILVATAAIASPAAANFAGLWKNYQGQSYLYVAYASDTNGANFSLTPAAGLNYIAWLTTNTPITAPQAANFAGLWVNYQGPQGNPGQSAYIYIAYASDANGSNFTTAFNANLNYIAIKTTTTPIISPQASDFIGSWKQYGSTLSVTGALTLNSGVLGLNATANTTANYVVQRDVNGSFSANNVSVTSLTIGGAATLSFSANALTINQPLIVNGLTIGSLTGVLKATSGAVSGGATTSDLSEGDNLYFTSARVLATPLAGLASTNILLATDTVLSAFGKLDNVLGGNLPAGTVSGNLSVTGNLIITGNTTLKTTLNGILQATNGVVSGSATTDNVPEGTTNLYFTNARVTAMISTLTGAANGLAPLDANAKVPLANLYAVGATAYGAAGQEAMLALTTAKQGDFCLRSDQGLVYVLANNSPTVLSSWVTWMYPVMSVNGATGAVVLNTDSLNEGASNLYFTAARADARIAAQRGAVNGICPLDVNSLVPVANLPPVGNSIWTVSSQSAQTGLTTAVQGDLVNRTDQNVTYILSNSTPSSFSSWVPLLYPVASVNGLTGTITLTTSNVSEGANLYFTVARVLATQLTGFAASSGTVSAGDTILTALQKLQGSIITNVTSVNGATGAVNLTTTNISEGSNLYFTNARVLSALTGSVTIQGQIAFDAAQTFYSSISVGGGITTTGLNFSGSGPGLIVSQLTATQIAALPTAAANNGNLVYDTTNHALRVLINGAFADIAGNYVFQSGGTMSGTLNFSGDTNPGLIVNQLSAASVGNLSTSSANNGNLVYDTTNNQLKVLVNGSFVVLNGAYMPTIGGNNSPMTGTLYFQDGLATYLQFGNNWSCRNSNSNANFDLLNGGTVVFTMDNSNTVHAPSGWFDTPNGYRLGGNAVLSLNGSQPVLNLGGNWTMTTTSAFANLTLNYGGGNLLTLNEDSTVNFSNDVTVSGWFKTSNGVKVNGTQVLGGQQGHFGLPSLSGNYGSDYYNLISWMNNIQNVLQSHGLMASS